MWRFGWVALTGAIFACAPRTEADAGVTDAGLTAQQFCDAIRDQCAFEVRCGQWVSEAACEEHLTLTQADTRTPCERFGAALAQGRITFDQRAAEHCVEARDTCDYGEAVRSCDDVFLGAVEPDGGCYAHEDCIENFYCSGDGTCPGHCKAKKPPGADANSASECVDNLLWDEFTCGGYLPPKVVCVGYPGNLFQCFPELYCDGHSQRCERYKKRGAPCGTADDFAPECEPGLSCSGHDGGATCELPKHLDEGCGDGLGGRPGGACQQGLLCRNDVCSFPGAMHATCYDSRDCEASLQCTTNRRCEPRVPVGGPCDAYNFCELTSECRRYELPDGGYVENFECVPIQLPTTDANSCPITAN